jgi:energy-coupling factor transport system permease protein
MNMLSQLPIGQYVHGHSLIHQLDPRTKSVVVFFYILAIFLANNTLTFGLGIFFVLFAVLLSDVPLYYLFRALKPVWLILILTYFFHLLLRREGALVFEWGWIKLYEDGLILGGMVTLRIFLLILMTTVLTLTTKPLVLTNGLERLFQPLKRMRVPVHEIALMISIAIRFIPTLMQEMDRIIKAQRSRGASLTSGSFKKRVSSLTAMIIPLFISSFQRAEELALAMEARGYRGETGRTQFYQLTLSRRDIITLIFSFAFLSLLVLGRSWST